MQVFPVFQSDPLSPEAEQRWQTVVRWLETEGWPVARPGENLWTGGGTLVADPTGGSQAGTRLPALMASLPAEAPAGPRAWWSMSDNCLALNALVDRGLCRVLHGHPLTLAGRESDAQRARFRLWSQAWAEGRAFPPEATPPVVPLHGSWPLTGAVVGGNLTALEKLAVTPWRPRPQGRILLVESLSAPAAEAGLRLAALVDDPWWVDIGGLLVGRFTRADREDASWLDRTLHQLAPGLSVARWPLVGHGAGGWTVPLGEELVFRVI